MTSTETATTIPQRVGSPDHPKRRGGLHYFLFVFQAAGHELLYSSVVDVRIPKPCQGLKSWLMTRRQRQ